jgi:hypothetical protein
MRGTLRPGREKARAAKEAQRLPAPSSPSAPSAVPPPPKSLQPFERVVWLELAPQIEQLGSYRPWMATSLRNLCGAIGRVREPDFPQTSLATLTAVIAKMMREWGLTPTEADILRPVATTTPAPPANKFANRPLAPFKYVPPLDKDVQ